MAISRRQVLHTAGLSAGLGLAGCVLGDSGGTDDVESYRDDLSRYSDVAEAVSDGFEMTTPYVRTDDGALGIPFVNYGAPTLVPGEPNVLFYHLLEDGTYQLLGVKWLVAEDEADARPSMFGQDFHGPVADETGTLGSHYGLHAWLFHENPSGVFARYHTGIEPPTFLSELETVWSALNPYYSNEALAQEDGYTNTETCIAVEAGGYSIPFINPQHTGVDPTAPAVLLYRFSSNWNYRLVGAEWYVPADQTEEPPSMFGQPFHEPMDAHGPETDQPAHYGLHAWAFTANPGGLFAPFNPLLEC